jgi:hypothetical protein
MKYLVLSLILLTSCGPKFKVNDCIQTKSEESWEKSVINQEKIAGIGKTHYHLYYIYEEYDHTRRYEEVPLTFSNISYVDDTKEKIECPQN